MSVSGLKAAIIAELNERAPTSTTDQGVDGATYRDLFAEAVADAVINYIKTNAEISSGVTSLPVIHPMGPGRVAPFTLPAGTTLV